MPDDELTFEPPVLCSICREPFGIDGTEDYCRDCIDEVRAAERQTERDWRDS